MGACFNTYVLRSKDEKALHGDFRRLQDDLTYEYGHDAYNGTLATCRGLGIASKKFCIRREAEDFIMNNTEKWSNALAVSLFTPKKPFKETAKGMKLWEAVKIANKEYTEHYGYEKPRVKMEKANAKYAVAERAYLEKKMTEKSAKFAWLVGGWCAE